ncbi:hypothetical protein [Streptosporangium sp. NPDC000509]|uniref:hypothetical protein n=1 Tax=Streptosporangium sp. NPDC000509 TaxID=3366186 RepID=UPI0036AEB7F9
MGMSRGGRSVARTLVPVTASLIMLLSLGVPAASGSSACRLAASATVAWRADPLTITVPASAGIGTGTRGASITASLGTVTVLDSRGGDPPWTATVSATDFTSGTATITKSNVSYWSGTATAQSGAGTRAPGQSTAAQAVALSAPATAFSGRKVGGITQSTSWRPTIIVAIPSTAIAGVYTGTIMHSVA